MDKLKSRTYKGIDYIQLSELPDKQYLAFMDWVGRESIITIQVNGTSLNNCVQYSDYSYWYDSVFSLNQDSSTSSKGTSKGKSYGLAFDN